MECRVEFDYVAQEPDELTIKKGDIIKNVQNKMDGWYEGTLRGKTGVFPDNFVKILEKTNPEPKPSEVVVLRNNPSSARRVRVLFSYSPEQDDELPLEVGDILEFIEEVEEGWWRGKLKGREGIFPSNFVEEFEEPKTNGNVEGHNNILQEESRPKDTSRNSLTKGIPVPDVVPASPPSNQSAEDEPAPELPPKPVRELARCFYPYTALNEDELTLSEGDIVTIISKQCEDEGWWRGELRGKIGLFPDNFVKIITPGEAQSGAGNFIGPHGKMLAQERGNVPPPSDFPGKTKRDSVGTMVVDGGGLSKGGGGGGGDSKIVQAKLQLNKTNSKESQQVPIIAPKVGHAATSPISPGIAAFHSNLFSNPQKAPDAFAKNKEPPPVPKDDKLSDESEDFNSVERTEILNHLTATRAKAPKRRPPSTVITRENDVPMLNGSSHSYDNSMTDSPPPHFSTPLNHSVTSNGTLSGSYTDGGSSLNHSGSFLSHNSSRGDAKEGSPAAPSSANSSGVSATKPKKQQQQLPWMAELKQTQDKKRGQVPLPGGAPQPTTGGGAPSQPPPTAPASNPPASASQPQPVASVPGPKDHVKAPPLPAKPSSLSSSISAPTTTPSVLEKTPNNNLNHNVTPINNTSSSSPYGVSNKSFTNKKSPSPAPAMTVNHNHHATTNSSINSSLDNSSHLLHRGGDASENSHSTSNKSYVTFEEHQALKTRVTSLENEVETLKRQIKLLMDKDRDYRGHIV